MDYGEAVNDFEEFFSDRYFQEVVEAVKDGRDAVVVEFEELDIFSPELTDYLRENPVSAVDAAEEGILSHEQITDEDISVRFVDMPDEDKVLLKNLRSEHIGKFIPVEGMIKRASQVKPEVVSAIFECTQCGARYEKEQDSADLKSPYKCEDCGAKTFDPKEKNMTDTQVVTLEEDPESREGSEQPSSLSVRLEGDLVDPEFQQKIVPGNVVEVTGVVRERPLKKNSKKFDIYMEANHVEPTQQEFESLVLSQEEKEEIKQMAEQDNIYQRIVNSIAPSIFGHDRIKEAIALQLFGGVKKTREDGVKSRGDLHILLIGEPGTGKSQMLKFAGELAPKGRYVVGKSSTGAGLTASVVKEESTGEFSLEAGAVVLAHKGMAAIDEIDKMAAEDRSSLHEAMEQQCFGPKTSVYLPDGTKENISELVDPVIEKEEVVEQEDGKEIAEADFSVVSMNSDEFDFEEAGASVVGRREAPDKMFEIELGTGRSLNVTPEHPFFQIQDGEVVEVKVEELKQGSFVLSPREMPVDGEEQSLDDISVEEGRKEVDVPDHNSPALAKFVGYQVSDGGYELNRGEKVGFNFTNSDQALLDDYIDCVDDLFGVEPYIRDRDTRKEVRVISRELKDWLQELGPLLDKGETKKIPERLMKCRVQELKLLLRSFFDGDGGVYETQRGYRIRAVVENRELMEQVQDVLLRLGIHSALIEDENVWRIEITRYEDIRKFSEHIGFESMKKSQRLEEAIEEERNSKEPIPGISSKLMELTQELGINQNQILDSNLTKGQNLSRKKALKLVEHLERKIGDLEEVEIKEDIQGLREKREEFGISMREVAEEIGVSNGLIGHWEKNGTKRTKEYQEALRKILNKKYRLKEDVGTIRNILENLRLVKIKNIQKYNPEHEYVYDLTVPENKNFIAENTVQHNSISVNKANIQATLNAETSILAAGNPKLGRFDPYEPIPEQINIGDTLLSRFDFIFPVLDEPDEEKDKELADTILQNHIDPEEVDAEIEQEKLRKYIAYAKKNIRPQLTEEASQKIQEFYVNMRKKGEEGSVPITARQLEALIRIAEASARAQLKEEVDEADAEKAIDILTYTLKQVGMDPETGEFDIDIIESGVSNSQRNRLQTIKQLIDQLAGDDDSAEIEEVLEHAEDEGMEKEQAEEIIERLKREGELFEPEQGHVQKI
ncbi:MAG: LAGLIDADG family homing endonuclease [Candidatus Nanohalobium sp.]